ncbi:MAG: uroporphyrinogen-III synthase [Actinobacteria bacterium]|nr:uroporphyrinogen-III synthase [Actinomycetota bacterium]
MTGEVIKLREELSRLEKKPLFGKRILVTRAKEQAGEIIEAFQELGAEVIECPTIKTVPPDDYSSLDRAIDNISSGKEKSYYDWIIFTSANGVKYFFDRLRFLGKDSQKLTGIKLAAIGEATAERVRESGLNIDYMPKKFVAESVVEDFKKMDIKNKKILIPRAEVAREVLPDELTKLGAKVDIAIAYKTVKDDSMKDKIKDLFLDKKVDVVTFTSSSTAENFLKMIEEAGLKESLENSAIAVIGQVTADKVTKLGYNVNIVPLVYTIKGLVEAIKNYFIDPKGIGG